MRAAYQGEFDGLCGIYSVINAIQQLGMRDPHRTIGKSVFRSIVKSLSAEALRAGLTDGIDADDLVPATRAALAKIRRKHQIDLRLHQPYRHRAYDTPSRFLSDLKREIDSPTRAAIVSVTLPNSAHWSVVRSLNTRTVVFRDSARLSRLPVGGFGINGGRRHFITADTLVLEHRSWLRRAIDHDLIQDRAGVRSNHGDDAKELDHIKPSAAGLVL